MTRINHNFLTEKTYFASVISSNRRAYHFPDLQSWDFKGFKSRHIRAWSIPEFAMSLSELHKALIWHDLSPLKSHKFKMHNSERLKNKSCCFSCSLQDYLIGNWSFHTVSSQDFRSFRLSFFLSKIVQLKFFCEITNHTIFFQNGLALWL